MSTAVHTRYPRTCKGASGPHTILGPEDEYSYGANRHGCKACRLETRQKEPYRPRKRANPLLTDEGLPNNMYCWYKAERVVAAVLDYTGDTMATFGARTHEADAAAERKWTSMRNGEAPWIRLTTLDNFLLKFDLNLYTVCGDPDGYCTQPPTGRVWVTPEEMAIITKEAQYA